MLEAFQSLKHVHILKVSHSEPWTLLISNKLQHFSLQENRVIVKSFYWLNKIFLQILKPAIKKAA